MKVINYIAELNNIRCEMTKDSDVPRSISKEVFDVVGDAISLLESRETNVKGSKIEDSTSSNMFIPFRRKTALKLFYKRLVRFRH